MNRPLLCSTVTGTTTGEMCARRDEEARHADLVELRLDTVERPSVAQALEGRSCPAVVTCRPRSEGGAFHGSEEERLEILAQALRLGAEYVDIEWRTYVSDAGASVREAARERRGRGVVLSMHDFSGVPADLDERVRAMVSEGSEVVKVAVTPKRLADCIRLGELVRAYQDRRIALVGMGPHGVATRVLPQRFGSCWTYAGAVAPGQITTDDMLQMYGFARIAEGTRIFGVAGSPVSASLSPAMHNAWFAQCGFPAVYLPFETSDADDFLALADWLPVDGASITAPLKTAMFERMKEATTTIAQRTGAINTLVRVGRAWTATNTDIEGFLSPLRLHPVDLYGKRCAVVGAGGAARAVAFALGEAGASVTVHARRESAAAEVASIVSGAARCGLPEPGTWDVLVNATPVRWDGSEFGFGESGCQTSVVFDLISNPPDTPLLQAAARCGCTTISGVAMLAAQAEVQAELWTGSRPPEGFMLRAAKRCAERKRCD